MIHKVLLVDDEPGFLALALGMLYDERNIQVVGHAATGEEALALLPELRPEVVIVDVNMPGMSGFEVAGRVREASPAIRLIMVSTSHDPQYDSLARSVGAVAFLSKHKFSAAGVLAVLEEPTRKQA